MSADEPSRIEDHHKLHHPRTYDLPQFFGIVENQVYRSHLRREPILANEAQVRVSPANALPLHSNPRTDNNPRPLSRKAQSRPEILCRRKLDKIGKAPSIKRTHI